MKLLFEVKIQSPMQSCRSLQSLSISANVSTVVRQRLIFGRKFNKLTEEKQQELISSQINIKYNVFGIP